MSEGTKKLLLGIAIGAVGATLLKSSTVRKGCAKLIAGASQLKDDAAEYLATIKEDAEDIKAEKDAQVKA